VVRYEPTGAYHPTFKRKLVEAGFGLVKVNRGRPGDLQTPPAGSPRPTASTPPCWQRWARCSTLGQGQVRSPILDDLS
jgi:hypothetical protein